MTPDDYTNICRDLRDQLDASRRASEQMLAEWVQAREQCEAAERRANNQHSLRLGWGNVVVRTHAALRPQCRANHGDYTDYEACILAASDRATAISDALDIVENPGTIPIGAPNSVMRRAWDLGQRYAEAKQFHEVISTMALKRPMK